MNPAGHQPREREPDSPSEMQGGEAVADTHAMIAQRLSEIAGVDIVGLSNNLPMDGYRNINPFYAEAAEAVSDSESAAAALQSAGRAAS